MPMKKRSHSVVHIEKNVPEKKDTRRKSAFIGPKGSPFSFHEFNTKGMDFPPTKEYDPLESRNVEHPTTNFSTIIHLSKAATGAGILSMPDAFRNAGLVVGPVGMVLIAIVSVYCMHVLVNCSRELCRRIRAPSLSFAETAQLSFQVGPKHLRKFSNTARVVVNVFLCLLQLGVCCVYFVFVPTNIENFVRSQWGYEGISPLEYMAILLLPMIALNMIRNLDFLAPFMMVANIALALGLGIIMYYVVQDLPPISERVAVAPIGQMPLYFGTAMYAFIAIPMILPVENAMKTPKDFGGWSGVLNISMTVVASALTVVGFFGYLKYGDDIQSTITLNLPSGDLLAQSVQLLMALSIFLSYALQFYVPINIMWPAIKGNIYSEKTQLLLEYGFRLCLVLFTFVLAAAVPDLSLFISLVGAFCSTTLGLIFPPIISMLTNWTKGYGRCQWKLVKDVGILLIGVIGMLAGTYVSLQQVLAKF